MERNFVLKSLIRNQKQLLPIVETYLMSRDVDDLRESVKMYIQA